MTTLLREYRSERFPWFVVATVPLLLVAAARVGVPRSISSLPLDWLLALLLFAQFRIADDLADRSRDARVHPDRSLVRAATLRPFAIAVATLAAGTLCVLFVRQARVTGTVVGWQAVNGPTGLYIAIGALLSLWYFLRAERTVLGDHLLLAKYPAFVWIVARPDAASNGRLGLSMMAAYLAACLYEALHDDRSPARARPALVVGEGLLLAGTLAALSIRGQA